ncbi:MAG TPA: hypothetical protein ENK83_02075 [Aliiroseovarius sp.]|nr:hypothetical protein [Aliiroseovarius sp.]
MHDVAEALDALTLARQTFGRVSFDLIYARQDQSLNQWKGELERALSMGPDHLSLYQLTIEPGTAFGARAEAGKLAGLPGDALAVEMYALTQEMCDTAGLEMYEVSNHAKKGQESRHNLIYWQSGDWLGIGPGAHGRLTLDGTRITTMAPSNPREWLSAPLVMARETLPLEEQAEEALIMGLRLRWGIDLPAYEARYGVTLNRTRLTDLISLSLVELDHGNLRLTPDGWPLLNTILLELSRD